MIIKIMKDQILYPHPTMYENDFGCHPYWYENYF